MGVPIRSGSTTYTITTVFYWPPSHFVHDLFVEQVAGLYTLTAEEVYRRAVKGAWKRHPELKAEIVAADNAGRVSVVIANYALSVTADERDEHDSLAEKFRESIQELYRELKQRRGE